MASFLRTMFQSFRPYPQLSTFVLLGMLIEVAYLVAAPISLQYLVDDAFLPRDWSMFILILSLLIGFGIVHILAGIGGDYALGQLGGAIIRQMRTTLLQQVQRQSIPFFQQYKVGDLVARFSTDMAAIETIIRVSFPSFLKEAASVVLGLTMLFLLEWKLTLAVLAGTALLFVGPRLLQRRAEHDNEQFKAAQERFSNTVDELSRGHKTLISLHQHARFGERARVQIQDLFRLGFRLHLTNMWMERIPLSSFLMLNALMIGFGGYLIFQDEMTVGSFMAFFTLFMSVGQACSNVTYLVPDLIDSSVSYRRINDILSHEPTVAAPASPVELPHRLPSLAMHNVSFGYDAVSRQLHHIDIDIAPGSYVAFVGPSGSGKSTALQLLARFYDPDEGSVTIGGHDLRTISDSSLRRSAVLVTQDTFLFPTTVRDNLLLDRTDTTEAELDDVMRSVHMHDVVQRWPGGYETALADGGGSLSGGERQRLSLARALLRKPNVLLLDEVTSALDPFAEEEINQLVEQLRGTYTVVSVTHRLRATARADHIYVFQEGRIAEHGAHEALMANNGLYRQLWEKQHGFHLSADGMHATVDEERLGQLPFFAGIAPSLLQTVAAMFATETFPEGTAIVREGEEGNKCYIIVRGTCAVWKRNSQGEDRRVAVLEDGDHFGEIALLRNIPRTATVQAMSPVVLLSIRREQLHVLTRQYPQLLQTLEHSLQQRM